MTAINETEVEIHGLPVKTSKVNSCLLFGLGEINGNEGF